MQKVRHDESRRTQGCVAGSDRCRNHADDGEDTTNRAQPRARDNVNHQGSNVLALVLRSKRLQSVDAVQALFGVGEERTCRSRPDKREYAFSHHSTVEDPPPLTFVGQAARHDRRLRAMEAGYSTAGDADEHHREDRQTVRLAVVESVGQFGHGTAMLSEHHHSYAYAHEQQHAAKDGIEAAYQLIHRQDGSQGIVSEDNQHPGYRQRPAVERHRAERSQPLQQRSRAGEERGGKQQ